MFDPRKSQLNKNCEGDVNDQVRSQQAERSVLFNQIANRLVNSAAYKNNNHPLDERQQFFGHAAFASAKNADDQQDDDDYVDIVKGQILHRNVVLASVSAGML